VIYFLTFYTEGQEIDGCFDLTREISTIKEKLGKYFTDMFFFNKRKLKNLPNSEEFCNVHSEKSDFSNAHKLGYYDFKPFIIDYILSILPEDSLLFYHDANFSKYTSYWETDWENIESISEKLLNDNSTDFYLKYELQNCYIKNFAKAWTVDYFFPTGTRENEIVNNSLLLNAGQIIFKNTENSRQLVSEWMEYCKNKDLLRSTPNPNPHPESKLSGCQEQDVLNCLIYKRILEGKLPKNFPIYGFYWRTIKWDQSYILENTELINYLNNK